MNTFPVPRVLKRLCALVVLCAPLVAPLAQPASKEQLKGLDEQVQDIKKDVLAISAELLQLEEKLLYPSNTQMSLFVSMAAAPRLQLDSVRIKLDGKDVAHHIYTFKEIAALRGGGIQRILTTNVRAGEHVLEVVLSGKTESGGEVRQTATHAFKKAVEPKLLEIVLGASDTTGQAIQFKE